MGRKSDARERILDSALQLIYEKGYSNVGVEEIMLAAGVGKSSFYHFFKSKEELGEAVLGEYSDRMCSKLLDLAFDAGVAPLMRPLEAARILSERPQPAFGCLFGNSAVESAGISEKMRAKTHEALAMMTGRFADAYSEAIQEMELMPHAPVTDMAQASVAYLEGVLLLCRLHKSWEPMKTLGPMVSSIWQPYTV